MVTVPPQRDQGVRHVYQRSVCLRIHQQTGPKSHSSDDHWHYLTPATSTSRALDDHLNKIDMSTIESQPISGHTLPTWQQFFSLKWHFQATTFVWPQAPAAATHPRSCRAASQTHYGSRRSCAPTMINTANANKLQRTGQQVHLPYECAQLSCLSWKTHIFLQRHFGSSSIA